MDEFTFFKYYGGTGKLLRPMRPIQGYSQTPSSERSKLYKSYQIYRKAEEVETNDDKNIKAQYQVSGAFPRIFSDADLESAVQKLQDFCMDDKGKIEDPETAELIISLIERQTRSDRSVSGFFEMLRNIDPNRTRSYRMRLVRQLHSYFEDRSVAKMVTEAFSREWKAAQKEEKMQKGKASLGGEDDEKLSELIDFDRCFSRWSRLLRSLRRKELTSKVGVLGEMAGEKDGLVPGAFLYLLNMTEASQKEFRQVLSNTYSSFVQSHMPLLQAFQGQSLTKRKEVYQYLRHVYIALSVQEILEQYQNILKLDGPSAQSMCPDKKHFIFQHSNRVYQHALENASPEIEQFIDFLRLDLEYDCFIEVTYNRKDILVKVKKEITEKTYTYTFQGEVDKLDSLTVTLTESAS